MHRVEEFHKATGQPIREEYTAAKMEFRGRLMKEEAQELVDAIDALSPYYDDDDPDSRKKALSHILKEMCDVIYVIQGTALAFNWDLSEAYDRVCKNNMTKTVDAKKHPTTGKVLKPDNYKKVNLEDLVS